MKAWAEDAIEQIATAELLNSANTSTGERLALIICDNAVEYMMIAYTEMEKQLVHQRIGPNDWEQTKRKFHQLLAFTVGVESSLSKHQSDIQSFHNTRNDLYHTGKPLTVKSDHVAKYLKTAKDVLELLFSEKLSEDDWAKKIAVLNQKVFGKAGKGIKAAVTVEVQYDLVRVDTNVQLKNSEVLCVVLDAFMTKMGKEPTIEQLDGSLRLSHAGHLSGQNLSKRIHDCRKKGLIQKDAICLTPKGQLLVTKKTVSVNS